MGQNDKIIYTAIIGPYDNLIEPLQVTEGWKYICFTDQDIKSDVWEVHNVPSGYGLLHRDIKIRPRKWLPPHTVSIWVDGNIRIDRDLNELLGVWDFVAMEHPDRTTIYQEAFACVRLKKDLPQTITNQIEQYGPDIKGLYATGILIRRDTMHNRYIGEWWFSEVQRHSCRDQLSLPYIAYMHDQPIKTIPFLEKSSIYRHK